MTGSADTKKAREVGHKVRIARAVSRALDVAPVIAELQANGLTSLRAIAAALDEHGVPPARREVAPREGAPGAHAAQVGWCNSSLFPTIPCPF